MRRKVTEFRRNRGLPDGYRARQIDGVWYLFDNRNVMLAGPADAATVEERAWRDVWRRIDTEIEDDIAALRAGRRPLHDMRRLRQYLRMWGDVAKVRAESEKRPSVPQLGFRRMIGAAALAAAAALVIVAASIARGPGVAALFRHPEQHAGQAAGVTPKLAARTASVGAVEAVPSIAPTPPVIIRTARRPPVAKYAVRVGNFANAATAQQMLHLVRQKGYIVDVVSSGAVTQVVTRPYRTRTQASYVARGLEGIGLPAELIAWRMP